MKTRTLLLAMLLLAAAPVQATDLVLRDYDLDSASFIYPVLCTPTVGAVVNQCPGPGYSDSRKITTAGAASTTVTSVGSNGAFGLAAVGDVILISPDGADTTVPTLRRITAKASADSITVDANADIATAGAPFRLWSLTVGTGAADDGWFRYPTAGNINIVIDVSQMNAASVDYHVQCRHTHNGGYSTPVYLAGTAATPISLTAAAGHRVAIIDEAWDSCRVGLRVTTDDGGDTGANAEKVSISIAPPGR